MAITSGVEKFLTVGPQAGIGTIAVTNSGLRRRRVTSTLSLQRALYQSAEKVSHYQVLDARLGMKSVAGTISGELSPASYEAEIAAFLRRAFTTVTGSGALTNVTAATGPNTFTRAAGDWIANGFRVGMVVRVTGWTTTGAANNNKNFTITALTALIMTVAETVAAKTSGDSVTFTAPGKVTWNPLTSHTRQFLTFEHWFPAVTQSERFVDCVINGMDLGLPAEGMATIGFNVLGRDMQTGTAEYFVTPTAESTTGVAAAVTGALRIGGSQIAVVTGLTINGTNNCALAGPVVGSTMAAGVTWGRSVITGQFTAFFEDGTLRDAFAAETEVELHARLDLTSAANSPFFAITMNRLKLTSADKDDPDGPVSQTIGFQALLDPAATGYESTTCMIQDSQLS